MPLPPPLCDSLSLSTSSLSDVRGCEWQSDIIAVTAAAATAGSTFTTIITITAAATALAAGTMRLEMVTGTLQVTALLTHLQKVLGATASYTRQVCVSHPPCKALPREFVHVGELVQDVLAVSAAAGMR
jgi:hypothetical protein